MDLREPQAPAASPLLRPPAACTIIARNYLSQARILVESYLRHEPSGHFYLLVVDRLPEGVNAGVDVRVIEPEELELPYAEMSFKYDVTELCTAVKPTLLSLLLNRYQEEAVIYFDPDILITRPLDELKEALTQGDIVLIPHILEPIPMDGRKPSEQDILLSGAYNLGFIALRKSAETEKFLNWWGQRLLDGCRVDPANGMFVDQKWVDFIPGFFSSTVILRDETYDVAYWNLHSRRLERSGEQFLVNGRPLAFFHFSGFDLAKPHLLSRHQNRINVTRGTALEGILKMYAELNKRRGYAISSKWKYGYDKFDNGVAIIPLLRRIYLELDERTRKRFGNPFNANGQNSFLNWATKSQQAQANLSPFLLRLHQERSDLAAAFPDVGGKDRGAFLSWAGASVAREAGYEPDLALGGDNASANRSNNRAMRVASSLEPMAVDSGGHPIGGINVVGYLRDESGTGEAARRYVSALRSLNIPIALMNLSDLSVVRSDDSTLTDFNTDHPYEVNLFCVNADQHFVLLSHVGEEFFQDRYNIGVWHWELPGFPKEWHDRFPHYDEVWVASSFIADTLTPVSPIPVVRVPLVLAGKPPGSGENGRRRLGVAPDEFVFLFIFDFNSYFERKNPLALIDAFKLAFKSSDSVRLVIKCVKEDLDPNAFATLKARAQDLPVSIYAGYWTSEEMRDLMAACDAYVSLHHSEGLGLTLADAMALGKPVIATGWSGNMDFMNAANSFPVRYELVQIKEDVGPYRAGEVWAEPSVEHAAELMRLVVENRDEAHLRGQAAKRDIETNYSAEKVAEYIRQRLAVIANRGLTRRASEPSGYASPAVETSETGNEGLMGRLRAPFIPPMDLDSSLYGWPGRLVKRAISFLLGYHTWYQQQVNSIFSNFMRQLAADQHELANELAGRFDQLETRLEQVTTGQSELAERLEQVKKDVANIGYRFAVRPYMASDVFGAAGDLSKPMGYALDAADMGAASATRPHFSDLFRGSEVFIAERQRAYLPFFNRRKNVIDLGCGRGEFLRLLREEGIQAVGIDLDSAMVQRCAAQGLQVVEADALEYLRNLPEGSLDAIFCAQFIEHLDAKQLDELLTLVQSRLRKGGIFIAETVNPESYEAQKAFYVDLSHQRPIFPQVLLYLCREAGFPTARIFYPLGGGFTQQSYQTTGEYAVVAVA